MSAKRGHPPPAGRLASDVRRGATSRQIESGGLLRASIVATSLVLLAPLAALVAVSALVRPIPSTWALALVAVGVSSTAAVTGTAWWSRRPESVEVSFGELMLWSHLRRRRAERRLTQNTALLGLDRTGQPAADVRVPREQQLQVLRELTTALESKDPYTHGHSRRVERHCYRVGMAMGLTASQIEDLRKAASLHDVGKIRVPDRVLRKPEGLTIDERTGLEEHVVVGAWMVSGVASRDVIAAVRHHHERFDGRGYPDGLAGTDIPFFARIIAVADAYDAMISTRPYRAGLERRTAVEELRAGAGIQFDPDVVEAFLESVPLPVPVPAFIPLFSLGRRLFGDVTVWAKRAGAGSVAQATGAVGMVAVLGAATVLPSPPAAPEPETSAVSDGAVVSAPELPRRETVPRLAPARAAPEPSPKTEAEPATGDGEKGVAAAPAGGPSRPPGQRPSRPAPPRPAPAEDPPSSQGDHSGHPRGPPPRRHRPPGDPRPDKGRDCAERKNPRANDSPGRKRHCDG